MINKKSFKTKETLNGPEIELAVIRPSPKTQVQSQLTYNSSWSQAERSGSVLRRNLDDLAERHGLWGPELRSKVEALENEIVDLERKLRGGAASFSSVEDAKEVALKLRSLRSERVEILRARNSLDSYTAEAFAEGSRLQYLVSQCTIYNEGSKAGQLYFKSFDDYISKSDDPVALDAFNAYLELSYGDNSVDEEFYEVKWLKKYGFLNDEGRLVDKQGRYISEDNKLIDKDYNYITEEGLRCDRDGVLVSDTGEYLIEYKEFGEQGESSPGY